MTIHGLSCKLLCSINKWKWIPKIAIREEPHLWTLLCSEPQSRHNKLKPSPSSHPHHRGVRDTAWSRDECGQGYSPLPAWAEDKLSSGLSPPGQTAYRVVRGIKARDCSSAGVTSPKPAQPLLSSGSWAQQRLCQAQEFMAWHVEGWGTALSILYLVLSSHCPWQGK